MRFGDGELEERSISCVEELAPPGDSSPSVLWVDMTGPVDAGTLADIGRIFGLHALSLEDTLDPSQRAKVEDYAHYTFVVLKTLAIREGAEAHPLNIFLGERFVVTVQSIDDPALEPVRERLRSARGRIRDRGADYLAYAIVDSVIDHYFPVVEAFDDRLESIERAILEEDDREPIALAREARHDLQILRHAVWPAREVVKSLLRDESRIGDETRVHLRDCYDHVLQVQEMIEASREVAASLLEAYLSRVSLRMNEVMKVLTVIATIFIPLTFITSLYGMNFNPRSSPVNMPELNWYWGYPMALLMMAATVVGCLMYFRRKGWLGGGGSARRPAGHDRRRRRRP